jgi:hypothetical protein
MLGTVAVGMNLGRTIQAMQVCRDAGHLFARSVDFSTPGNQEMLVRLARGLGLARSGGSGVVYLTRVMYVASTQCTDGGVPLVECTNLNQYVITARIAIGNTALRSSALGMPAPLYFGPNGEASPTNYLKQIALRNAEFGTTLVLSGGDQAYVAETYFAPLTSTLPGFGAANGVYARTIF